MTDSSASEPRRWFTRYEGALLAAAPGVGIMLALLDQFGRFAFLDVPPSFIELSPSKVVIATVSVVVVAGSYATVWAEEIRGRRLVKRAELIASHLFVNSTLACCLALTRTDGFLQRLPSMAAIAAGLTVVTYWGHMLKRRLQQASKGDVTMPRPTNIATFALCAILAVIAVVAGSS